MSGSMDKAPGSGRGDALRHWGGFALSGGIAFSTDALVLELLTRLVGLPPLVARLIAIACAMAAGWRAHRYLTFGLATPPTLKEFLAYAAVASTSAGINYIVFAGILLWRPQTYPLAALVAASLVAMTFAYLGMRFGAFRNSLSASKTPSGEQ